jgi:transposase
MPTERLSMRKIKEILRLKFEAKLTNRQIGRSVNLSPGTVCRYLQEVSSKGITWPLEKEIDDAELEEIIFGSAKKIPGKLIMPDWLPIHKELQKKGITKQLLWEEYASRHGESSYRYSQFCLHYHKWQLTQKLSMRQQHKVGEKLFVDYAGQTVPIFSADSLAVHNAQIFIAVLPVSNYVFAEATYSQKTVDWIGSHVRAFNFLGGVTEIVVPDNLKAAITKACKYDPDINPTYQQLACYYQFSIIPARPRKPKDKAKVEVSVQIVERWILAKLRHHKFFSISELNNEIRVLLKDMNNRRFSKLPGSRYQMFIELDKPALKPLPGIPYQYQEIKITRVEHDYHVEVEGSYYSAPYLLVGKKIETHVTDTIVSLFYQSKQMAIHGRTQTKGRYITLTEHMPPHHKFFREWSPERFIQFAEKIGPCAQEVSQKFLSTRKHPEQSFAIYSGFVKLTKQYSEKRLEAACQRVLSIGAFNYKSIESILKNGLDNITIDGQKNICNTQVISHGNVRGSQYYQ